MDKSYSSAVGVFDRESVQSHFFKGITQLLNVFV